MHAPLGSTFDGKGVSFVVFSEHATSLEVIVEGSALTRGSSPKAERRIQLSRGDDALFRGYARGVEPGALYSLSADGPRTLAEGHRFDPTLRLVDPYTRAIHVERRSDDRQAPVSMRKGRKARATVPAPMPTFRGVVVGGDGDAFDWGDDAAPRVAWRDTVIYEAHVIGLTRTHPDVPEHLRGTFAGVASEPIIAHLKALGVTALELLPVHHRVSEPALRARGLENYWGYSTLGFFAPDARFSSRGDLGGQIADFKAMVRALHRAGIEVILDVVYNHSCEGSTDGPTLAFRGLDNAAYYRLLPTDRARYRDYSGCGNTFDLRHPAVLQMVMDSLRYWATEMRVDGFRFDLAPSLARGTDAFNLGSAFLCAVQQDPTLARTKLIAEPWDLGEGGYRLGGFPPRWSEWNGKYRDGVRRFWGGYEPRVAELASRLSGSSDVFGTEPRAPRGPRASIDFITAHDGFTLRDLVTYEKKHNEENGESNRDGEAHNLGWNCGIEGETDHPGITALRRRQVRNMIATLFLSQGVPMICGGDEMGRTQRGNNNAYCQDNATSWLDWALDDVRKSLLTFTRTVSALRAAHPALRQRSFLRGPAPGVGATVERRDVAWLLPMGGELGDVDWRRPARSLGVLFCALDPDDVNARPRDAVLLWINGERAPSTFVLGAEIDRFTGCNSWRLAIDTAVDEPASARLDAPGDRLPIGATRVLPPLSMRAFVPVA